MAAVGLFALRGSTVHLSDDLCEDVIDVRPEFGRGLNE